MIQHYFGLKHIPFAKNGPFLLASDSIMLLKERFLRLLTHPGIGLLTGDAGVGKTACLHHLCNDLNPHQYEVFYLAETQFTSFDIYLQIAQNFNLKPAYRFAQLWREIKNHIQDRFENKHRLPILIIDEAQNLPGNFFRGFHSFLNFAFDSRDMLTVWFVGHPELNHLINRHPALSSRVQAACHLKAIDDREQFTQLLHFAFKEAGATASLIADSGIELLRIASHGKPRLIHRILLESLTMAASKGLNHLPDEVIEKAITQLKG